MAPDQKSEIRNQKSQIIRPQVSRERFSRLAALIIILAGLAAYANSLSNAFVFDDIDSIVSNPAIRHLWPPWKFFWPLNRPVVTLTLAVNYAIGRLNVAPYHAFNIAVHILAALTLFGLVRRTLLHCRLPIADCRMVKEKGESTANGSLQGPIAVHSAVISQHSAIGNRQSAIACALALATALIWEVHPLQTESVAYIIQRAESLAGLFYLLTLYCIARGALSDRPLRWYAAAFAACALGLGTKQTVATAPLVALLYDRAFLSGSFREALRRRWAVYVALAATWLLVIPSVASPGDTQHVSAGFQMSGITPMDYAVTQLGVILRYLRLSFWPAGLCLDYNWPRAEDLAHILPGAVVVGALLAATAAALALRPAWGFLGAWFFLILAPTSSFMPIADAAVERRMYLPLAAVAAFVVIGGCVLLGRLGGDRRPARTWTAAGVFLIVAVLGYLTALRNLDYRSEFSIWDDTVRKAPANPRAVDGRGKACFEKHDYGRAIEDHDAAIRLDPNYAPAYNSRAITYNELRQFDNALRDCDEAIRLDPNFPVFHNTRGVVLAHRGEYEKAIRDYNKAVDLNPGFADAYMNRGVAYGKTGRLAEALADFDKAIALNSDYPSAYYNRGNTYADREDYDRAIRDYTRAITLRPDYREAWYNRAVAWFYKKDYRRSWADIRALRSLGAEPAPAFLQALTQAAPPD
jgi:tetratricopeptide (TPR) repeat protein